MDAVGVTNVQRLQADRCLHSASQNVIENQRFKIREKTPDVLMLLRYKILSNLHKEFELRSAQKIGTKLKSKQISQTTFYLNVRLI